MNQATRKTKKAASVAKALLKSFFTALAIVVVSVFIIQENSRLGVLLMLAGSCTMVLATARKKFPLNPLTCLMPGIMAVTCFILQALLPMASDNAFPVTGFMVGALVGWILGRTHKIEEEKGLLMARRTLGYVFIWILTFLGTQAASLWGIEKIALVGLALSGFSTAVLAALSITLLSRYHRQIGRLGSGMTSSTKTASIWILVILTGFLAHVFAQGTRVNSAQETAEMILKIQDLPGYKQSPDAYSFDTRKWIERRTKESLRPPVTDFGCNIFWFEGRLAETFELDLYYFDSKNQADDFYYDPYRNQNFEEQEISGYGDAARRLTSMEVAALEMLHGQWFVLVIASPWSMHSADSGEERAAQQVRLQRRAQLCLDVIGKIDRRLDSLQSGTLEESEPWEVPPPSVEWIEPVEDEETSRAERLSEKAEDTGKAAAIIQLAFAILMSTSMAASESALHAVTVPPPDGDTLPPPSPPTGATHILDGQDAVRWLQEHDMLDKDGNFTETFSTWFDKAPGEIGSLPSGLEGFAGKIDRIRADGTVGPMTGSKPDGPVAIIVREPEASEEISSPEPAPKPAPRPDPSPSPEPDLSPTPPPEPAPSPIPPPDPFPSQEPAPAPTPSPKPDSGLELTPAWQNKNPLLDRNPNSMFTSDYMKNQIDMKFQGADSEVLSSTMYELTKNPQGDALENVLRSIADIRDRPMDKIRKEYQKYRELRKQRDFNNPAGTSELSSYLHPRFMGSTSQLRSGKIVGDAFGVDPVFGALLNPTGGLVGPANWSVDADDSAVGYHGAMHDAAGYLYNSHKVGPGYDYLRKDQPRDTAHPLSGQHEGIRLWREMLGEPPYRIIGAPDDIMRSFVAAWDETKEAFRWGIDMIDVDSGKGAKENVNIF